MKNKSSLQERRLSVSGVRALIRARKLFIGKTNVIERDVKKYVKEIVKEIAPNSYCFMPVQTGMGAVDLDLIFDVAGYSLRVETKRGGLQPKASQLFTIKGLDKAGTPVLIIDESNIEDVAYVTNLLLDHKQIEALEYARENRADYCK